MPARSRGQRKRPSFPALEWLGDAAGLKYRLVLCGNTRAMVENHTGILEFGDGLIRLKTRGGVLRFEGSGLTLTEVRPGALCIRGAIFKILLDGKGENDA